MILAAPPPSVTPLMERKSCKRELPPPPSPVCTTTSAQCKCLVVDDIQLNRMIITRMLNMLGMQALEARNGQECLDVYSKESQNISCVLLDLNMPVLDGWQTAERLRKFEAGSSPAFRVPIVVCTATRLDQRMGDNTVESCALAAGADECLKKPMNLERLRLVLDKYLALGGQPEAVGHKEKKQASCACNS